MANLNGKRVLVTGAARGIGYATAEQFAGAGCELVLGDIDGEELRRAGKRLKEKTGASVHTTIRYAFDFEANGTAYRYVGAKVNIRPWNLPVSHTTCFGTIQEQETGRLVSRSIVYFKLWRLPAFLASLRPT